MGGLEILILIGILLAKAQRSPKDLASAAAQAANTALKEAADAHAAGDHKTAVAKRQEADQHAAVARQATKAASTPPPWPQVIPSGLPPFPSAGWHPASPVTSSMVSRGWQLLPQLWASGEHTWKPEKTGDRWVVYQAAQMGDKRGVIAFTTESVPTAAAAHPGAATAQRAPKIAPAAPAPQTVEVPEVDAMGNPTGGTTLATFTPAASHPAAAPAQSMPTLRLMTPRMRGPSVVWLQQKLGTPADGVFGPGTQSAVIHFQSAHGLTADGVVGPNTWHALGVGAPAGTLAA
jgi:Putative peptidoglycan binding domain